MSRNYATRGNKYSRIGNEINIARIQNGLMSDKNYKRWDNLLNKICRIPNIMNIEIIELTNKHIRFKAICSDKWYYESEIYLYVI